MKKTYKIPNMDIIVLNAPSILSGSSKGFPVETEQNPGKFSSRSFDGDFDDDEEDW